MTVARIQMLICIYDPGIHTDLCVLVAHDSKTVTI